MSNTFMAGLGLLTIIAVIFAIGLSLYAQVTP